MFSIVKNIDTLTISDFDLYERNDNARYLMKFHFPALKIFAKKIEELTSEIAGRLIGDDFFEGNKDRELHRLESLNRINHLSALWGGAFNIMAFKPRIDKWAELIEVKCTSTDKDLKIYLDKIKNKTGIDIEKLEDLERLQSEIDRWVEKYHELFLSGKQVKGMTFMQTVIATFSAVNLGTVDMKMSLARYFEMRNLAIEMNKEKTDGR